MSKESNLQQEAHSQEKIKLHKAKIIINSNGYIFKPEVLNELVLESVVRIFFTLKSPPLHLWSHDAPYVSIVEIKQDEILGEVLDLEKIDCNRYPLACGERIWFNKNNIIEIPLKQQSKNKEKKMKTYITDKRVTATGPLYTIEDIDDISELDSDSDESVNSYSDC